MKSGIEPIMKLRIFVIGLNLFIFSVLLLGLRPSPSYRVPLSHAGPNTLKQQLLINSNYGKLPIAFEPNLGQMDASVKYLARGSGYTLFVTSQEAVLSLKKPSSRSKFHHGNELFSKGSPAPTPDTTPPTVLRLKLEGAQTNPVFESLERLPGIGNYFIGNDHLKWHTNIPQYSKVAIHRPYPGVDMVYYGNQGKLEYDFLVQPGADPRSIHLRVDGAQGVAVTAIS